MHSQLCEMARTYVVYVAFRFAPLTSVDFSFLLKMIVKTQREKRILRWEGFPRLAFGYSFNVVVCKL